MTPQEFNEKWKDHLEEGHYGMAINNELIINVCDDYFENLRISNPDFKFSQIKLKFGYPRVYLSDAGNHDTVLEKLISSKL
jgi:hypothetical protein